MRVIKTCDGKRLWILSEVDLSGMKWKIEMVVD